MSDENISDKMGEDIPGKQESEQSVQERLAELKKRAANMAQAKKSMKKEEKHTKKSEDKLVHFLIKFIQAKHNSTLLMAVTSALASNVSANIVLYSLILTNDDLLKDVDVSDIEDEELQKLKAGIDNLKQLQSGHDNSNLSLQIHHDHKVLPPHLKAKLHFWAENIYEAALLYPHHTFEIFEKEVAVNSFKYLISVILFEFFQDNHVEVASQKTLDPLVDNIFLTMVERVTDRIEKTLYLKDGAYE